MDGIASLEVAVHDADVGNHAAVNVEYGVEDEGSQRCVWPCPGRMDAFDDRFEDIRNTHAGLCADEQRMIHGDAQDLFDLTRSFINLRAWHVNLVEYRNDFEVVLDRQISVCHGLGFDALCCIDHEDCAFARTHASGYFVGEVHMSGGVNQVKAIGLAILGRVEH